MSRKKKQTSNAERKAVKKRRQSKKKVHATALHSRVETPKQTTKTSDQVGVAFNGGFSFQSALSQVRNVVEQQPKPVKQSKRTKKKPVEAKATYDKSPYVLDLKSNKTVLSSELKPREKKSVKKAKKDTVFSLFENKPAEPKEKVQSFGQHFKKKNQQNFAPIPGKLDPSKTLRKIASSFSFSKLLPKKKSQEFTFSITPDSGKARNVKVATGGPLTSDTFAKTIGAKKKRQAQKIHKKAKALARKEKRQPFKIAWRGGLSFAALSLLLMLPIGISSLYGYVKEGEAQVLGATNAALSQLQEAKLQAGQLNFLKATEAFEEAGQAFQVAGALVQNQFGPAVDVVSVIPAVGGKVKSAKSLLSAGADLSRAASLFSQGAEVFTASDHFLEGESLSYKLEYLLVRFEQAEPLLRTAQKSLEKVDVEHVPEDGRAEVRALKASMPDLINHLSEINAVSPALLSFVGHEAAQRYLVVFQNNTELRATGGFMGSLALIDLDRGEINNIEIPGGGPYDYQGSLFDNYKAPRALQLINPRWELQDANWFLDFPTSAEKIQTLYEKAGGPSVDGVIAIDTQVLERLLAFIGGVEMEGFEDVLTAENFREILQNEVEFNYDKELNQPKKVIADLAPILLEEVKSLEPSDYLDFADNMGQLLQQRSIQLFHNDESISGEFVDLGWSGHVVQPKGDYLAVVHTNLAGGKTDAVVDDKFDLTVHVDEKGQTTNTLTISRKHNGIKGQPLTGVRNVDYLRVYVPLGSKILSATGFELPPEYLFEYPEEDWIVDEDLASSLEDFYIDESTGVEVYTESGKTVFAHWIQVDPGQTATAQITYQPPKNLKVYEVPVRSESWLDWLSGATAAQESNLRLYNLYWQKQPGSWNPEMQVTVNYPQQWLVKSDSNIQSESAAGKWQAEAVMVGDSVWQLLFY